MQYNSRRGYSLIELAIVLGVIGVIMGTIWGYASTAYESARRQQMQSELITLVTNIRGTFSGQMGIPTVGTDTFVPMLIQNHVIPQEMVRVPSTTCTGNVPAISGIPGRVCADTPWGPKDSTTSPPAITTNNQGTVHICDWTMGHNDTGGGGWTDGCNPGCAPAPYGCTGSAQFFGIILTNLSRGGCIQLAEYITGPQGPTGLQEVNINGCNILEGVGCPTPTPAKSLPISADDATNLCSASGYTNILRFIYSLRLPGN